MQLWLNEVPPYMLSYAKAIIFLSLLYAIFEPIRTAVLATNNIVKFMIIPNVFYVLSIPICYLSAILSDSPVVLIMSVVAFDILGCILRTYYALRVTPLLINEILSRLMMPSLLVVLGSIITCYCFSFLTNENLIGLIILLTGNSLFLLGIIYIVGINRQERQLVNGMIKKIVNRR